MSTAANYDSNKVYRAKQKTPLEGLLGVDFIKDGPNNSSKSKDNVSKTPTPTLVAYKYSNNKRETLHESAILAGHPVFIKYENGQVKALEQIDEGSIVIRPPSREECPYPAYEFAHLNEVEEYVNRAKNEGTCIESLYSKAKEIVLKYVDQEEPIIILLVADLILSYFQDLFPTHIMFTS